jgi:PAS domain S-box-containing protein
MKAMIRELATKLQRLSPFTITVIGVCSVLALGISNRFTPAPMSFVLFHMLVVVFVGWGAGKWPAVAVSGVAVITMETVHWRIHQGPLPLGWAVVWNSCMRLVALSIAGCLTAELTRLNRHLSDLVEARTAQWKAEVEQHKTTSAQLREAVERFEQVINNIAEVFWLTNVHKNEMAYISPAYERIWGRQCEELHRDPQSWLSVIHPEDREGVKRRARTEQASGAYDVEYRILRPDGELRWIRDRAFPVRNPQGEVYRIAGIAEDITERKRTREMLQTQAAILENMAEGVVVSDEQGLIVQMNPAGERIWGYERAEALGRPLSVFSALPEPEATAVMHETLEALHDTGSWRGTFKNRRKDGAIIACEAVINRLEVQGRVLMVAVEQDVTERLRAQEQLQMQARVLESMAEAVLMLDDDGTILLANPAADTLLGYERGELVGKSMLALLGYAPEEFRQVFDRSLEQVEARGSAAGDHVARRKDGSLIEVELRASGIRVGGRSCLVVVGQDVTQRKQAEQALRQSEETLRVFLNALPAPALLLDRKATIQANNQALVHSLGLPEGDVTGKEVFSLMPAEVAERRRAVFDEVVRTRKPVHYEDTRAGRHFVNFDSPVLDPAGNVARVAVFALDITERKQVEAALARQEALYRTLFELSPDGIVLEDMNGNILDANQAFCRAFGYPREALMHQNVRWFVPPEHQAEVQMHLATLRSGQPLEHEVWNVRKSGERCLMRLNEKPLALPNGRQGILVVARDITQSKRAELTREALLSLGAKLSAATSPVEAARSVYDAADHLWAWDAACLDLYYPESDRIHNVLNCDIVGGQRCDVPAANEAGTPSPRMRRIIRQGAELICGNSTSLPDGDCTRFGDLARASATKMFVPLRWEGQAVGVLSIQSYLPDAYSQDDLQTLQALADYCAGALERIQIEQALQQREEFNRNILSTAMDGFFTLDFAADPGGVLVEVNDAYCRLVGYSREELLQMKIADLEAAESPTEVARHKAVIMAAGADRFETLHRRKDGQEIHVEISVSRLTGSSERVFGFVRDITERKRAELMKEVLLSLGTKLNAAASPVEAARAVFAGADQFWKWDAATLDLYSAERDWMEPLLFCDVIDGQRREVAPAHPEGASPGRMRRIMQEGAELILRQPSDMQATESVPFGDASRPSASLMFVPLSREGKPVGVLSIQSYTPNAYTQEDLRALQALADYCAGALDRIRAEAALHEAHDLLEQRVEQRTAELRAANEVLRRTNAVLQAINQGTDNIICLKDTQGKIIMANPAMCRFLGKAESELIGTDDLDSLPDQRQAARIRENDLRIMTTGCSETVEESIDQADRRWHCLFTKSPYQDESGKVIGLIGIGANITARKRAEEALRDARDTLEARVQERTAELQAANAALTESEERYRSLVTNLNVGVYRDTPGPDGRFLHANPSLARMHGYESVEEFQKVKVADLYQVPEDRKVFLAELFRQGSLANYEVRLKQRDGTPIYGSVSAAVHRGPDGEMDYIDGVIEDITERKKAEQTLAEALELNRTLISASTVGIAVYHASGRCILANEALARISGGTLDQLREQNFRRLKSWRADGVLAIAEAALKTGQPQQFEGKSRASFGRELAINARFAPFVNRGEQHLLVMVTDETEAQRAQQALRASEERYRALAESSPDAIFILDRDIKIQYVNSAAASWWRRPPEELIGLTQADLFPPETAHHHCQVAAEVLKTGQPLRRDESLALPTGEQWIEIRLVPLHGEQGGVNWVMGVCRDISERKRAEIALQQAERLQRAILDNIPDPAWLKDAKGRFLACNQAIATFYGQPVKALLGKTVLDCKPAEAAHSTSEDQEVMTTRRSVVVEAPSTDAQGRVRWWESIKSPLFNERDEVIGTVGIARDVTERRRLERHILEISDREQARLGQDIHDGLCQQLVSLAFDANSLQSELSGRRLPETKQARRIADCLDQAITEARQLSRGLFPVRLETDGLPSAMAELAKAASARFQIQCRFDSQGRVAVKDVVMATHLYRIAQEALANAVKHSRGSKVSIRLKGGASQLELTVEDDGAGLSAAKRKKATGMGLHIMAYRARAIGGTLHLGPGPRGGMLVSCCIPRGTG